MLDMIKAVGDFNIFAKYWNRFATYAKGEGFEDAVLYKALAGRLEVGEMGKVTAVLNHWLVNHLNDEDRDIYAKCFDASLLFDPAPEATKEEDEFEDTLTIT